ncbi:hypothetical protein [Caulobacter sp.]|uniref:hypothetical protein n=1 Tax=Caulobacter sp. TaxID=78 RepID=UPI001B0481D4|nr:hypothetical protein [Caulobacter sp.]MBO9547249.1 hypothetical protein [Caulobacter sp.]
MIASGEGATLEGRIAAIIEAADEAAAKIAEARAGPVPTEGLGVERPEVTALKAFAQRARACANSTSKDLTHGLSRRAG